MPKRTDEQPLPQPAKRFTDYLPLGDIKGAAVNPKDHDLRTLTDSVKRFGYTEGVMLDERTGRLVAGHGRVEMLRALKSRGKRAPEGIDERNGEWFIPVQRGWASKNDTEASAYVIASNKTLENGGWNEDLLTAELEKLADEGSAALAGIGFDISDLEEMNGEAPERGSKKKKSGGGGSVDGDGSLFQVLVEVDSELAQSKLLERLEKEGFTCRPLIF